MLVVFIPVLGSLFSLLFSTTCLLVALVGNLTSVSLDSDLASSPLFSTFTTLRCSLLPFCSTFPEVTPSSLVACSPWSAPEPTFPVYELSSLGCSAFYSSNL